jgi:hypothetical protein
MLSYDDIKPNLLKSFIEGQTFEEENFQKITGFPPETKELYFLVVLKTLIFLGFDWNRLKDHPQVADFVTVCLKELKDYQNIRRSLVALTGRNIVFYSRIIRMEKEKKGEEKTEQELSVIMDILKPESRKVWADKVWEKVRETSESENAS